MKALFNSISYFGYPNSILTIVNESFLYLLISDSYLYVSLAIL